MFACLRVCVCGSECVPFIKYALSRIDEKKISVFELLGIKQDCFVLTILCTSNFVLRRTLGKRYYRDLKLQKRKCVC